MKTSHAALSAERIRTALDEERIAIDVYDELDSTNSEAKRRARAGDRRPTLILAESQSGGRGRMGRSFFSPAGAGIYMTYLWHPDAAAIDAVSVTTAASVAVLRALLTLPALHGRELGIKWVNDVYLDGKKVCGILTEAVTDPASGRVTSVLVGIGINVLPTAFPPELADIATAIGGDVDRSTLAAAVLRELLNIQKDPDPYAHMACYKAYSTVIGKRVNTIRADAVTPGRVLDIDPTGGLVVEREDGSIEVIHSGEVSLRT
ncbi:MAG: biotin--[Clostridia bacterium]|nr:biotin--[acetyl-CoA-carboxylase] ligase [Clostridia bacterium]